MNEAGPFTTPRPITADDNVAEFDCGKPPLDVYLRERALSNHVRDAARCYVTTIGDRVAGYYALATSSVVRSAVSGSIRRNMPDPIPAVLLARLAVDAKYQSNGLGRKLLLDAILRTIRTAEQVAVRVMLVHAIDDEAAQWYRRSGFELSPTDPHHLFLLVQDARDSLRAHLHD